MLPWNRKAIAWRAASAMRAATCESMARSRWRRLAISVDAQIAPSPATPPPVLRALAALGTPDSTVPCASRGAAVRDDGGGARGRGKPPLAEAPAAKTVTSPRVAAIDVLRGLALVAMVLLPLRVRSRLFSRRGVGLLIAIRLAACAHADPVVIPAARGVSLVLAQRSERGRARFWRHVAMIAACAVAVSVASYLVFPRSYIWFGVLHAIALALILIRPLAARPRIALVAGIAIVVVGNLVASAWFDQRTGGGWVS
jgi:hypothetical protein